MIAAGKYIQKVMLTHILDGDHYMNVLVLMIEDLTTGRLFIRNPA